MISDKEFLEFLNDDSLNCSLESKLKDILDEELEKSEDEMDTDLIEYCLDALQDIEAKKRNSSQNERNGDVKSKKITRKFGRILLAAAIISAIIISAVSVSAIIPNVELFDGVVELYNEHVRIHFNDSEDKAESCELLGSELSKELANNGFPSILLPEELLSDQYEVRDIEYQAGEMLLNAAIRVSHNNEDFMVYIYKYADESFIGDTEYLHGSDEIYKLIVSRTSVYVFEQGDGCTIAYKDGTCEYTIATPFDIEKAKEFAKTIK